MKKLICAITFASVLTGSLLNVYAQEPSTSSDTQYSDYNGTEDNQSYKSDYIPSELDYNTPVYTNDFALYSDIPASYSTSITDIERVYPTNRNQNPYGTCWAFSSIGLAEFDLINDGTATRDIDLSELQLIYFTFNSVTDPLGGTEGDYSKYYNENAQNTYLDCGGNYDMTSRRLAQWVGVANETEVPYKNAGNVLANGLSDDYAYSYDVAHLQNAYIINIRQNQTDVKQQIMEHGAVGIMYYHDDNSLYWNSSRNEYTYYDTSQSGGGHAVMVVGWDDNYSKDNFLGTKPANDGAWLIRNSWGMYCNYFWMSYDTASVADSAWVFDFNADDGYDNNYQLDGGLLSYPTQYTTMANIFTAKNDSAVLSETLKAVSVSFTRDANVNYTIDVYTDLTNLNDPTSGTKQESATTQGSTAYAGIYTIELADEVTIMPGSTFSVVVNVDKTVLDCEQAMSTATGDDLSTMVWDCAVSLNNGKTFFKSGNRFYAYPWGNLCVKAFTTDNTNSSEPDVPVTPDEPDEPQSPYIVDGIDYSIVFDPDYYYSHNSDLADGLSNSPDVLFAHFINYGIHEGRQACESFNVHVYKANSPDLAAVYGSDFKLYYDHYILHGKDEGRIAVDTPASDNNFIVDGIDYSVVFNPDYYYDHNADLADGLGNNSAALFSHFINYGIHEGRQACESFNVHIYKTNSPDLAAVYGSDFKLYYDHYILHGKDEGRIAVDTPASDNNFIVDGIDYSVVFNPDYYYNHHADLADGLGNNSSALFSHFINYGIHEGRQACESFNVHIYKTNSPDLAAVYGSDFKLYYDHYILHGKDEGRIAVDTPASDNNFIVDGIDYSVVFNPDYYYSHNADLADGLGNNSSALFSHFINYGIHEGRQACETFNVNVYKTNSPDLAAVYGSDFKLYYDHYILHGKDEGRISY